MPSFKNAQKFIAPAIMSLLVIFSIVITEKHSDSFFQNTLAPISTLILIFLIVSWAIGFRSHQTLERRPKHGEAGAIFPHKGKE